MKSSNKDLFEYYCDIAELPATEQKNYIEALKAQQPEVATQLEALVKNDSDLTQVFSDAILDFTDEDNLISVGDRLTNYKLTQALGNGGMGQVFKAERCDGKIDQSVAIKFLHPLFYQYQSGKLLFQEAQALAQLNHPNIASIYDIAETENGHAYIIMEYVEGVTLDVYLQQNDLSVDKKLKLFNQIADAVLEAHNHQIIHADIKPSNVLITASGQAKLIDFGVMQLTGELTQTAPKLVTHYLCAMTVNYASPEQLNGTKATISSDIYGLGGLLYFMLSGKSPFEDIGGTLTSKIEHINSQTPKNCTITDKLTFKSDIVGILHKSLAKTPKDRYRTATDLINDIQAFQQRKAVSVSASNRLHNSLKFFYRNRFINTALTSIFIILLVAFIQINIKSQQIIKEKQSLHNVSEELKRTYSQRDKSLADAGSEGESLYLPNPNKLELEQYVELMLMLFDNYYQDGNVAAAHRIALAMDRYYLERTKRESLTKYLIKYRYSLVDSSVDSGNERGELALKVLFKIEKSKVPLDSRIIKLFTFINQEAYSTSDIIPLLIAKIENDVDFSQILTQEKFIFHYVKGRMLRDRYQYYAKSVKEFGIAYDIARSNPGSVKLWQFLDVINGLITSLTSWQGFNSIEVKNLVDELSIVTFKLEHTSGRFFDNVGMLLRRQAKYSMESIEDTFQKLGINSEMALSTSDPLYALTLKSYAGYLLRLGNATEAELIMKNLLKIVAEDSGTTNNYYNSFLTVLAKIYGKQGKAKLSYDLFSEKLIPYASKYMSLDYIAYYKTQMCFSVDNSYLISTPYRNTCLQGYNEHVLSLGKDNYWTNYSLLGYVRSEIENKNEINNSLLSDLVANERAFQGGGLAEYYSILFKYFLYKQDQELSELYLGKLSRTMLSYNGSVDAINRYYYQILAAELDVLKGDKSKAITKLTNIHQKMCDLGDKNPQKIKYLKLKKSLSQPSCLKQ